MGLSCPFQAVYDPFMDRYDRLTPNTLLASIASMKRRWKEAMHVSADKNIEDFFTIETDAGSIAEHCGAAITQLHLLRSAIRTTTYNVPEPLGPEVAVAAANTGTGPWPSSAAEAMAELNSELDLMKVELDSIKTREWTKTAQAGSTSLSVLALAQGASRVAADRLNIVERLVRTLSDD